MYTDFRTNGASAIGSQSYYNNDPLNATSFNKNLAARYKVFQYNSIEITNRDEDNKKVTVKINASLSRDVDTNYTMYRIYSLGIAEDVSTFNGNVVTEGYVCAPEQVNGVSTTTNSDGSITVNWSNPGNNNIGGVLSFALQCSPDQQSWFGCGYTTVNDILSLKISNGLKSGTNYFRVFADNTIGLSKPSNIASATFKSRPNKVTNLAASWDGTKINLTWSAPADNSSPITGYEVKYTTDGTIWSTHSTVNTTNLTIDDSTNFPVGNYAFKVIVSNSIGKTGDSNFANLKDPNNPDSFNLNLKYEDGAVFGWGANSDSSLTAQQLCMGGVGLEPNVFQPTQVTSLSESNSDLNGNNIKKIVGNSRFGSRFTLILTRKWKSIRLRG